MEIQEHSKRRTGDPREIRRRDLKMLKKLDRKTFIQTELLRLMEEEESYWLKD